MEFYNNPKEDIEKLSKAIVDAIVKSKEVKSILSRLVKNDIIVDKGFMMLMIKIQALTELTDIQKKNDNGKRRAKKNDMRQYIDGRELTSNEVAFLEYCAKNFVGDIPLMIYKETLFNFAKIKSDVSQTYPAILGA